MKSLIGDGTRNKGRGICPSLLFLSQWHIHTCLCGRSLKRHPDDNQDDVWERESINNGFSLLAKEGLREIWQNYNLRFL